MRRSILIAVLLAAALANYGCAVYQTPPAYGHEPAPRVVAVAPEFLYVIPSFGVYFVPNISAEIFFVNGRWYYNARGVWYWGMSYTGPWTYIEIRQIPRQLRKQPRDKRDRYRHEYYRVPYGHWEKRRKDLPPRAEPKPPPYLNRYKGNVYVHPRDPDVVFYDGYWYRRYKGLWYQGKSSAGPWRYPEIGFLPKPLKKLPPDYRKERPEKPYERVPWDKVQKKYRKKMEKRDREWEEDD
ncbi:MAG: hypothetical protein JSV70_01335 [bacterium]|nr:MAG: hypothetical protein JSV70_01335 [bacterium]